MICSAVTSSGVSHKVVPSGFKRSNRQSALPIVDGGDDWQGRQIHQCHRRPVAANVSRRPAMETHALEVLPSSFIEKTRKRASGVAATSSALRS